MAYYGLLVGLGNPGRQYEYTRHNIGFRVVERFCQHMAAQPQNRGRKAAQALLFEVRFGDGLWLVACPQTFMNLSGKTVAVLSRVHGFVPEQILVIHDELDLVPGTVQFKRGGGLAGHNGLRSIAGDIGSRDFFRLRLGIGRPASGSEVASYVLADFPSAQRELVTEMVDRAVLALQEYMEKGMEEAMQVVHGGSLSGKKRP